MAVWALGINHTTAPLDLRGRFAFAMDQIEPTLHQIRADLSHRLALPSNAAPLEATLISTCNRTEIYVASTAAFSQLQAQLHSSATLDWMAHMGGVSAADLRTHSYALQDDQAASYGYRMFECDVKLSADGVPFLLHDSTLERTTSGKGTASDHTWDTLSQLDAGSWHSRSFAGEPLPTFANIAQFCLKNGYFLNIEIKPTPGQEAETGKVVAEHAAKLWKDAKIPPLLTSFRPESLETAQAAAPHLPRGLLLDQLWKGWLETALVLDCAAIVCNYALWDTSSVTQAKSAGFRCLSYTVNDEWAAQRLLDLGTDGIITDRVDLFSPCI